MRILVHTPYPLPISLVFGICSSAPLDVRGCYRAALMLNERLRARNRHSVITDDSPNRLIVKELVTIVTSALNLVNRRGFASGHASMSPRARHLKLDSVKERVGRQNSVNPQTQV